MRLPITLLLSLACAPASPRGPTAPPPSVRVGPNVQVTGPRSTDAHFEVTIAAHPTESSRLVIGSMVYPDGVPTYGTIVYHSTDGGASWTRGNGLAGLGQTGDPALAYGPDGTAYYVASSLPDAGDRRLLLFRSADGGANWDGPFSLTYMDRQYVTVDAGGGARRGRVYVTGNNRVPRAISDFVAYTSSDGGRTFRGPATRADFGSVQATVMGPSVVTSDGTLVGVYAEASSPMASLRAIWSDDSGASLVATSKVDDYVAGGERKGALLGNANAEPAIAVDQSGSRFNDRLYVVWPDRRSGHSEIRFSFSTDRGRSWSPARVVNDNPPGDRTDQFMPEIAVNKHGVVGITWYDRREHPDNLGWNVRFAASFDGGATFVPSVKISERGASFAAGTTRQRRASGGDTPAERISAGKESFTFMGGDTAGLAADAAGVFHAAWVTNATGVPQVWTAPITATRTTIR